MRRSLLILLLLGGMAGCGGLPQGGQGASVPAPADENLLRRQVVAAQERSARLEVQVSQLSEQVKTLGSVVRELQGQQGRLEEQIGGLRRDLMAAKPASPPSAPPRSPASGAAIPPSASPRLASLTPEQAYNVAYRAVREKKSREAVPLFQEFLQRFPANPLTANAQYWLGESLYDLKEYRAALEEFEKVLQLHSTSRKVPDALFMRAMAFLRMQNPRQAALEFEKLIEHFPRHPLTEKAKGQLRTLNLSGNNIHR